MANFQSNKLPVSLTVGVNDNPQTDSAQGINGTKMILDFNSFVDAVESEFNGLSGLEKLTNDVTYYINPNTGSDSNDGLTTGTPFLTIKKALDVIKITNLNGYNVTIQLADGNYPETASGNEIDLFSPFPSQFWDNSAGRRRNAIFVSGNSTNPQNVVLNCCIWADYAVNGYFEFYDLTIDFQNYHSFESYSQSLFVYFGNVIFKGSNSNYDAIVINGGTSVKTSTLFFQGNYRNIFNLENQGKLQITGNITFTTLTLADSFLNLKDSSSVFFSNGISYFNTFSGKKFTIKNASAVREDFKSLSQIPGSIDGGVEQDKMPYKIVSAYYQASRFDRIIEVTASGTEIRLPNKVDSVEYTTELTIINSSNGSITVSAAAAQYIGNSGTNTNVTVSAGNTLTVITNSFIANHWRII